MSTTTLRPNGIQHSHDPSHLRSADCRTGHSAAFDASLCSESPPMLNTLAGAVPPEGGLLVPQDEAAKAAIAIVIALTAFLALAFTTSPCRRLARPGTTDLRQTLHSCKCRLQR